MSKMILAATLIATLGLTGCATTAEPEAPLLAAADTPKTKLRDESITTGSRIPGTRSNTVSSTSAAEAQKSMRDNNTPYTHKN